MTRYEDLQKVSIKSEHDFLDYRQGCRDFISELRHRLSLFLECDKEKIRWLQFSDWMVEQFESEAGFLECEDDNRLALYSDAFYRFCIGIVYSPENRVDKRMVEIELKTKKDSQGFVVHLGWEPFPLEEHIVSIIDETHWTKLLEALFSHVMEYSSTRFERFFEQKKKPGLGFLGITDGS